MEELTEVQNEIKEARNISEANLQEIIYNVDTLLEKANVFIQTELSNKRRQFKVETYRIYTNRVLYEQEMLNLCENADNETQEHKKSIELEMEEICSWYVSQTEKEKKFLRQSVEKFDELQDVIQKKINYNLYKYKLEPEILTKKFQEDLEPLKRLFSYLKMISVKDFSNSLDRITLLNCELNSKMKYLLEESNINYDKIIRKIKEIPYKFHPCTVTRMGIKNRTFEELSFHITEEEKIKYNLSSYDKKPSPPADDNGNNEDDYVLALENISKSDSEI